MYWTYEWTRRNDKLIHLVLGIRTVRLYSMHISILYASQYHTDTRIYLLLGKYYVYIYLVGYYVQLQIILTLT
jgi:hypothetical protein